jgi:hypothetical protein
MSPEKKRPGCKKKALKRGALPTYNPLLEYTQCSEKTMKTDEKR